MNTRLQSLQKWINLVGWTPKIAEDGLSGPATRAALIGVFANTHAPAISPLQEQTFAARLGGTVRQLRAAAKTESNGGGYLNDGHPKILWERHYAARRINGEITDLADFTPGGYSLDADRDGINDSWEHLADFAMIYPQFAFECASFGKFQIMGAWAQKLHYSHSLEFVWSMRESEAGHYEAFVRYIERFGLVDAFRRIDGNAANCRPFALGFNGPAQKGYDSRIAENFRALG